MFWLLNFLHRGVILSWHHCTFSRTFSLCSEFDGYFLDKPHQKKIAPPRGEGKIAPPVPTAAEPRHFFCTTTYTWVYTDINYTYYFAYLPQRIQLRFAAKPLTIQIFTFQKKKRPYYSTQDDHLSCS